MITQQQSQKQTLKILPQQIQLLNLFFLNAMELEQRISAELETNLLLEVSDSTDDQGDENNDCDAVQDYQDWDEVMYDDKPDYKSEYQNYFDAEKSPNVPIVNVLTFKEEAHNQLKLIDLPDEDRLIAEYIIDTLNGEGFMDRAVDEVAEDMSFHFQRVIETPAVQRALELVQTLEPIGIGSTSIRECLLIQLKNMDQQNPTVKMATNLLNNYYQDLMHRQFERIHHALKVNDAELKSVLQLVGGHKFHPVNEISAIDHKNTIIPDYLIGINGSNIQVTLCAGKSDSVFVNQSLHDELVSQMNKKDRTASQYVRAKLNDAQWFVNAVKQREENMLRIMKCIVEFQREYFLEGDIRLLKPMVLRNISDISGLDISTISRITGNKYAQTHFGLIFLKKLFSEGIADKKGDVISNKVIQSAIREAIESEDKKHPYTDQQLVTSLAGLGYNVARRTIAKYREQMQIPVAQIRAVWA